MLHAHHDGLSYSTAAWVLRVLRIAPTAHDLAGALQSLLSNRLFCQPCALAGKQVKAAATCLQCRGQ